MNGTTSSGQPQSVAAALAAAKLSGKPVSIANPDGSASSLVAYPTGSIGTPGGGFQSTSGTPAASQPPVSQPPVVAPSLSGGYMAPDGSYVPASAIPGVTPSSTASPIISSTSAAPMPPASSPDVYAHAMVPTATAAQSYRIQHGLATPDDTDALNAESLAAAQAGRTYFNPTLAAQYGQPLAAGVSGPRTDVVNALTMPPSATQTQQQPTQVGQNLLQQGIY